MVIDWVSIILILISIGAWIPIYVFYIIPNTAFQSRNLLVKAIENEEIDLNYLLNDVVNEIVNRVKSLSLAELGNLSRAGDNPNTLENFADNPETTGLLLSQGVLKALGLKNPGPILSLKMAQVLGKMAEGIGKQKTPEVVNDEIGFVDEEIFKP